MSLELYIEGQRVEMFKDEAVTINSNVQNVKDVSKLFTDYTQSFTVPASSKNNAIFKHWYKPEIENGFDARDRKDAFIELNHVLFKVGKVELNGVTKKNLKPNNYKITFYGNVVKLTDLFGEDLLTDLDLSAYNHDFDSDNVKDGIEGATLLSGDVIYPLISNTNVWTWGGNADEDIKYDSGLSATATQGLKWYELKPALRIQRIIDAIQVKYGVNFSDQLFNTSDFLELYLWASRDKGDIKAFGVPTLLYFGGSSFFNTSSTYVTVFDLSVVPEAGYTDVPYSIIMDVNGVQTKTDVESGTYIYNWADTDFNNSNQVSFYIQSSRAFSFDATLTINDLEPAPNEIFNDSTGVTSTDGNIYFSDQTINGVLQTGQLPKIKIVDFFKGILKMFNAVIIPTSSTTFSILPMDDWYSQGTVKDFTKYADMTTIGIKRPPLNKTINFKYTKPKTILQENFNDTNNIYYSDLEYETSYEGGTLDVQLPFESLLMSRISDSAGGLTDVRVGTTIDKELKSVKTAPIVFYNGGVTTVTDDIGFRDDSSTLVAVSTYNNVGQENALTDPDITNTLNFGSEVSTMTLSVTDESLFSNYWQTYISGIYDESRRMFEVTCYLPEGKITDLKLNDKIVINRRRYVINGYKAELTSGKVQFELLNDVVALEILPETNNGLEYELEFGLEG